VTPPFGRNVLLDAGPIVGLLDRSDQWHRRSVQLWPGCIDRYITSEPVVTEASHIVGRRGGPAALPVELLLTAQIPVVPFDDRARRKAALLMRQYENLPMDYADATLVVLAEALDIEGVFTFDERGFRTYRTPSGRAFTVLP
jgi:predicted nucleic acid-binding protein